MSAIGKSALVGLALLFCLSLPGCGPGAGESELSVASIEKPKLQAWSGPSVGLPPPEAAGSELGRCRSQSVGGDLFGENSASLVVDCLSGSLRPTQFGVGAFTVNGEDVVVGAGRVTPTGVASVAKGVGTPLPCDKVQERLAVDCEMKT